MASANSSFPQFKEDIFTTFVSHEIIETGVGVLKGKKERLPSERTYYSFQSVPYAKPPIGELRFKHPVPADKWLGILDATVPSPCCFSKKTRYDISQSVSDEYIGGEDCLYLNIYSPRLDQKLPVMVWIHGGTFTRGDGGPDMYGPQLLMERDVVLVTINYRLDVFGFLNLDIEECSGNMGLKDQAMALLWVKKYIKNFGGDPDNVTAFGNSAGATSVAFHLFSPLSKGLFHKAILQSGSYPGEFSYMRKGVAKTFALALAKSYGIDDDDSKKVLDFFRSLSLAEFGSASARIRAELDLRKDALVMLPSVEIESAVNPFMTKDIKEYIEDGEVLDIPIMTGVASNDGYIYLPIFAPIVDDMIIHPEDAILTSVDKDELRLKLKEVYDFNGNPLNALTEIIMDNLFLQPMIDMIDELRSINSKPIYAYCFDFKSERDYLRFIMLDQANRSDGIINGASHADDQVYIFQPAFRDLPEKGSASEEVVKNVVTLWTNFASTSNPNSKEVDVYWPESFDNHYNFLVIKEKMVVDPTRFKKRIELWKNVTRK